MSTDFLDILCRIFRCQRNDIEVLPERRPQGSRLVIYGARINFCTVSFCGFGGECAAILSHPYGEGRGEGPDHESAIRTAVAELSSLLMRRSLDLRTIATNFQSLVETPSTIYPKEKR